MTLEIFVPYWGDPHLLYDTVDSVLAQDDPDWRLVVIDDCYPDPDVAEHFASLGDKRVTYVRNKTNLGITENYREAVRRATGEYITILGCDDLLHPNYVALMKKVTAAHPEADVIQPGVRVIDEHGRPVTPLVDRVKQRILAPTSNGEVVTLTAEAMATSLIRGDWLYWPSLTFRTQVLRDIDFRDGLPIIQDLALLMDVAFAGGTLAYTPTTAFSYRRHSASASQKTLIDGRRFRDERQYYRQARELARAHAWGRTARTARRRLMSRLHAVTVLPMALKGRSSAGIQSTLAHIFAL